ncbi:MAG: hypothetical protein ABRQ26_14380 [Syntrophomonadaceae bacterium]
MNWTNALKDLADKDYDRASYIEKALLNEAMRDMLVEQLLTNPDIMIYYHCYEILDGATSSKPELFYGYWDRMRGLLRHKNSYHRNAGLAILANLSRVDDEGRTEAIIDDYMGFLVDDKLLTACYCVDNCAKIIISKPQLEAKITDCLLNFEETCPYTEKQRGLLAARIIEAFDAVFDLSSKKDEMLSFANHHAGSVSPKARKLVKQFLDRHR